MAVAAIALFSCSTVKEDQKVSDKSNITINVIAKADNLASDDVATKTYLGTNPNDNTPNTVLWGTDEYMELAVSYTSDTDSKTVFSTSSEANANGQPSATFAFTVSFGEDTPNETSTYTYQGLYPASAAVTNSNTNPASYKVELPATQNATASSYDPAAYIMVAAPETFNSVQTTWLASYRRATALNKITLKNVPSGVSIQRVIITAPSEKYLAGRRYINLATDNSEEVLGNIYYGETETIEVKYATPLTGTNVDVWFTSWDVEVAAGETLTIVAYTTDKKSYTKTITVPDGKSIKFQEGYLNTLGANMSGITPEDVTELAEGDYLILANNEGTYYALKAEEEDQYHTRMAFEVYSGSLESYAGNRTLVWSVSKSGDSYTIANSDKYLGWNQQGILNTTTGNRQYNNADWYEVGHEYETGYTWSQTNYLLDITWVENNSCYKIAAHIDNSRILAKNTNANTGFAFYTGSGYNKMLFVPAIVETRAEVSLSFNEPNVSISASEAEDFTGQTATAYSDGDEVDNLTITYSWDGESDFGSLNEETGEISLSGESGTATVTASFAGNDIYLPATASYTVTVIAPAADGVVLWQEDFTGYGTTMPTSATGTHVYGGGTVSYALTNGGSTTKLYTDALAGGTSPELLVSKSGGAFTVSGIPTGNAVNMTLSFKANNNGKIAVSTTTASATISSNIGTATAPVYVITVPANTNTISLTFTNSDSGNTRIDDLSLVVGAPIAGISVTTAEATNTSSTNGTTATLNGSITLENGALISAVTEAGFYYKSSSATSYTKVTLASAPTTTSFFYDLTGLTKGSNYTYYAYAIYEGGSEITGSSSVQTFTPTQSSGNTATSTLTFTAACGGTGIADDGASWTVASDADESTFDSTKGIHYGTSRAAVKYITLTTTDIPGTITKVVVNASTASGGSAQVSVTVGDSAFGGNPIAISSSSSDYTFEGSASGTIIVTVDKNSATKKALYVKSIKVTYTN